MLLTKSAKENVPKPRLLRNSKIFVNIITNVAKKNNSSISVSNSWLVVDTS